MTIILTYRSVGEAVDLGWLCLRNGLESIQTTETFTIKGELSPEIEAEIKTIREKWNPEMVKRGRYEEAPRLQTYGNLDELRGKK